MTTPYAEKSLCPGVEICPQWFSGGFEDIEAAGMGAEPYLDRVIEELT